VKLKSASCQIAYWQGGHLRIANCLTAKTFASNPVTLDLIGFFFTPQTIAEALVAFRTYTGASVGRAIIQLIEAQLLLECGSAEWKRDQRVESTWRPWLPEGACFHFMTKDTPYIDPQTPVAQKLAALSGNPEPTRFKPVSGVESIRLPTRRTDDDAFFGTVHARRTHRQFAIGAMALESVATLLQTTWGVQGYHEANGRRIPYKTSPSGGARHPVEVYLMALRVAGLERGIYHYQAQRHRLTRLPAKANPRIASAYCADQTFFSGAAALFIMTAVFARTMWKYGRARAYRVVLLETGHLCQTFCLTATRLGLAPFSTAAFKDSVIERDLGIDGISESVLYIAGAGLVANRTHDG